MRSIFLTILTLFGTPLLFGQNAITEAEYRLAYRKADAITGSLPHRRITSEDFFKEGKRSGYEKHTTETLPPDKTRYFFESEFRGEREERQVIKLGEVSYCKEGKRKWAKTNCDRFTGLAADSILTREYSRSEVILAGKPVTQFRNFFTYSYRQDDPTKTVRNLSSEFTFLVDVDGRILGSQSIVREIVSKEISSSAKTEYEYGLKNLKIEAPIK